MAQSSVKALVGILKSGVKVPRVDMLIVQCDRLTGMYATIPKNQINGLRISSITALTRRIWSPGKGNPLSVFTEQWQEIYSQPYPRRLRGLAKGRAYPMTLIHYKYSFKFGSVDIV